MVFSTGHPPQMPPLEVQEYTLRVIESSGLMAKAYTVALRGLRTLSQLHHTYTYEKRFCAEAASRLGQWGVHVWRKTAPRSLLPKMESLIPPALHSQILAMLVDILAWEGKLPPFGRDRLSLDCQQGLTHDFQRSNMADVKANGRPTRYQLHANAKCSKILSPFYRSKQWRQWLPRLEDAGTNTVLTWITRVRE